MHVGVLRNVSQSGGLGTGNREDRGFAGIFLEGCEDHRPGGWCEHVFGEGRQGSRFFELAVLIVRDALQRNESCGGHFREEYQTPEGEARRDDEAYAYVAAWEHQVGGEARLHKEALAFENVALTQRSYK